MDSFKEWLAADESSARSRAAMNPGIPAQPDHVFSKPPYTQLSIQRKLKAGGKFTNTDDLSDLFGPVREIGRAHV